MLGKIKTIEKNKNKKINIHYIEKNLNLNSKNYNIKKKYY